MDARDAPWSPFNFLALTPHQSRLDDAQVVLIPIPYDSTTSYKTGAREGPLAILQASYSLEDFDHELGVDLSEIGIHTTPFLEPHMEGPRSMVKRVKDAVSPFLAAGKVVGILGGEHTVSIGAVQALADTYSDLSVLYFDAHGDLRDEYLGARWGHANVARRLREACPVTQVGVRSISPEEIDFIQSSGMCTFLLDTVDRRLPSPAQVLETLSDNVYISIDLDSLDPSLMPAVGTPEPGGLYWGEMNGLLRAVAEERSIVGFDVVELSPGLGPPACASVAAKLVYKLVSYSTALRGK